VQKERKDPIDRVDREEGMTSRNENEGTPRERKRTNEMRWRYLSGGGRSIDANLESLIREGTNLLMESMVRKTRTNLKGIK